MKVFKSAISVLGLVLLTGCASGDWSHTSADAVPERTTSPGTPIKSVVQKIADAMPTGYYGQNSGRKMEQCTGGTMCPMHDAALTPPPAPVQYNESVNVYPIEDAMPVEDQGPLKLGNADLGNLAQQVFFEHGSAKINKADKAALHSFGESLAQSEHDYKLNVIGHASSRVDNVQDPIRKKMINFNIAQKRANVVTRELKSAGVKPDSVIVTSKGDNEPNPNPGDKTQEAADRRVDVYVNNK